MPPDATSASFAQSKLEFCLQPLIDRKDPSVITNSPQCKTQTDDEVASLLDLTHTIHRRWLNPSIKVQVKLAHIPRSEHKHIVKPSPIKL